MKLHELYQLREAEEKEPTPDQEDTELPPEDQKPTPTETEDENEDEGTESDDEPQEGVGEVAEQNGFVKSQKKMYAFGKTRQVTLLTKNEELGGLELTYQYIINPETGAWSFRACIAGQSEEDMVEFRTGEDSSSLVKHLKKEKKLTAHQAVEYLNPPADIQLKDAAKENEKNVEDEVSEGMTLSKLSNGKLKSPKLFGRSDVVFLEHGKTTLEDFTRGIRPLSVNEDKAINFNSVGNSLPDLNDEQTSKMLGTSDGYEIWGSTFFGKGGDTYCISNSDDKVIAMVIINQKSRNVGGLSFQDIEKVWVEPKQRGKALVACIIQFIVKKLNISLGSGKSITDDGEKMFKKLIANKKFKFKILNKGVVLNIDDVDEEKLFSYSNPYEIVIVENWDRPHSGHKNLSENLRLSELRCFRGDEQVSWD